MWLSENEIYNKIIDYLSASINDEEKSKVEQWINESEENKATFEKIELLWTEKYRSSTTIKSRWEELNGELEERSHKSKYFYLKFVAAAVVVLLLSFAWIFNGNKSDEPLLQTNNDGFISDTLDNGWVVYLYPNSMLTKYRKSFIKKDEVGYKFIGEGFFVVPKNEKTEITISVGDANLKVNGASFRVNSCSAENDFSVLVESGNLNLRMDEKPDNPLLINAGEKGFYSCTKKIIWKNHNDEEIYLIYQPQIIDM